MRREGLARSRVSVLLRAAAVLLLALALSAPGAASAQVVRHRDAVGDLWRSHVDTSSYAAAPRHVEGDISAIRVAFTRHAVWVRIKMRELTTDNNGNFELVGFTSDRRTRTVRIDAFPGHWEGQLSVTNKYGFAVPCLVRHNIDYARNRVTLRMARHCLGKASWVRVGARTTIAGTAYVYSDDARRTGLAPGLAMAYGRRVHRG